MSEPRSNPSSDLRTVHTDIIKLAAELVCGEGVPDWSERKFYATTPVAERRDILKALRDADEAMRLYAIRLKAIADKLSESIPTRRGVEGAVGRAREELGEFRQQDDYLLSGDASLMSDDSHQIIHVDTLRRIVTAALSGNPHD